MALSALARTALDSTARGGATYSGGYRTRGYANDPSTLRYKQFADEARAQGITDPKEIDNYALSHNQDWGAAHGITGKFDRWDRNAIGSILALTGGAAFRAGSAAAGAGE